MASSPECPLDGEAASVLQKVRLDRGDAMRVSADSQPRGTAEILLSRSGQKMVKNPLCNSDIFQMAEIVLQCLQAGQEWPHRLLGKKQPKELSGIAKILERNASVVALFHRKPREVSLSHQHLLVTFLEKRSSKVGDRLRQPLGLMCIAC